MPRRFLPLAFTNTAPKNTSTNTYAPPNYALLLCTRGDIPGFQKASHYEAKECPHNLNYDSSVPNVFWRIQSIKIRIQIQFSRFVLITQIERSAGQYIQGVPTSFGQESSKKSQNFKQSEKTRQSLFTF